MIDVNAEEKEKVEKYQHLKKEIRKLRELRNVEIVPVVIGAIGSVSTEFDRWMGKLSITCNVGVMQKSGKCKNTEKSVRNVKTRVFC